MTDSTGSSSTSYEIYPGYEFDPTYEVFYKAAELRTPEINEEIERAYRTKKAQFVTDFGMIGDVIENNYLLAIPVKSENVDEIDEREDNYTISLTSLEPLPVSEVQSHDTFYYDVIVSSDIEAIRCRLPLAEIQYNFKYDTKPVELDSFKTPEDVLTWIASGESAIEKRLRGVAFVEFGLNSFSREEAMRVFEGMYGEGRFTLLDKDQLDSEIKSNSEMVTKFALGMSLVNMGLEELKKLDTESDPDSQVLILQSVLDRTIEYADNALSGFKIEPIAYLLKPLFEVVKEDETQRRRFEGNLEEYFGGGRKDRILKILKS